MSSSLPNTPGHSFSGEMAERLSCFQYAFAFSGGGSAGAYTAGLAYGFHRLGVIDSRLSNVKAIHGVSTGALVASLMGLGRFEELAETYRNVRTPDIIAPSHHLLYEVSGRNIVPVLAACIAFGPPYLYNTKPLRRVIDGLMGEDYAGFAQLLELQERLEIGYSAVNLNKGTTVTLTNRIENMSPELLRESLLASSNQPILMDLVELPELRDNRFLLDGPKHVHCDGGLQEKLPLDPIMLAPHAEEIDVIVTVLLDPPVVAPMESRFKSIMDQLMRTVDLLGFNVGASDKSRANFVESLLRCQRKVESELGPEAWRKLCEEFPKPVRDFLSHGKGCDKPYEFIDFQPDDLGIRHSLEFIPEQMREAFDRGNADAEEKLRTWWLTRGQSLVPRTLAPRPTTRSATPYSITTSRPATSPSPPASGNGSSTTARAEGLAPGDLAANE